MDEQRRLEREALVKRLAELQAGLAQDQRELWDLQKRMESRLPLDGQFRRHLERLIKAPDELLRKVLAKDGT